MNDARRVYLILAVSLALFLALSWASHGWTSRWTHPRRGSPGEARLLPQAATATAAR